MRAGAILSQENVSCRSSKQTAFLGVEPALTKQIKLSLSPVLQVTFLIGVVAKASQGTQEALKPTRWATSDSCDDGHSSLTKTTHKWRILLLFATCLHFLLWLDSAHGWPAALEEVYSLNEPVVANWIWCGSYISFTNV